MRTRLGTIAILLVAAAVPRPAAAQTVTTDTLLTARADTRLEVHNQYGSTRIGTWDRQAVRVVARHSRAVRLDIDAGGATIVIQSQDQMRRQEPVDYQITIPRAMQIDVEGFDGSVFITDARGPIEVQTVRGDIDVKGGRDRVGVQSVQGAVSVTGARGSVEASTVNQSVAIRDVVGPISATAVNGRIDLESVDSDDVEATSVNGRIRFEGTIHARGSYEFSSHNGGIDLTIPEDASARVHVSTFNGTLHTLFPIQLQDVGEGKEFDFTLGSGQARIELQSFNGTIELRHP